MGKHRIWLAVLFLLLASVAWSRGPRTMTIRPQPVKQSGGAVRLHGIRTIVDHRDRAVYLRLEDVATLMQREITYTVGEDGTPTGEITIKAPRQAKRG